MKLINTENIISDIICYQNENVPFLFKYLFQQFDTKQPKTVLSFLCEYIYKKYFTILAGIILLIASSF